MGRDEKRAEEEAAAWLARLNTRSVTTEELEAFYRWRREPGNAERYARAESFWRQSRALGEDPDIAAAARDALARPRVERSGWRTSRRMVLAGLGVVPVAVGAGWLLIDEAQAYETGVGEQLAVRLRDRTFIRLNTDSRLSVAGGDSARRVTLERGQAFFEVEHRAGAVFEVRAGKAEVRATGTRFDIRLASDAVQVVLAQGNVLVAAEGGPPTSLAVPGACAQVDTQGTITTRQVDLDAMTAWTAGRMVFRATPLASAIAEANRYSSVPIELADPSLGSERVNGTFETGDIDSFIAAVTTVFDLHKRVGDGKILLSRK